MAKEIYEVVGVYTINVIKRVKAESEEEAIEKAEELFEGLETEHDGSSVFVTGEGEELSAEGYVEWKETHVTDNDDYDTDSDDEDDETVESRWCLCDYCVEAIRSRGERIMTRPMEWEDCTEEELETDLVKCDWCEDEYDRCMMNICN